MDTSNPNTLSVQQDLITTENLIFVETVERCCFNSNVHKTPSPPQIMAAKITMDLSKYLFDTVPTKVKIKTLTDVVYIASINDKWWVLMLLCSPPVTC